MPVTLENDGGDGGMWVYAELEVRRSVYLVFRVYDLVAFSFLNSLELEVGKMNLYKGPTLCQVFTSIT